MKQLILTLTMTFFAGIPLAKAVQVGDQAPNVSLVHIEASGKENNRSLLAAPEGKAKLLEFFSITCSACAQNLPLMKGLTMRLEGKAITTRISVDRNESAVRSYVQSNDLPFAVALDSKRVAAKAFGFVYTPELYVLDAKNKVIFRHQGVLSASDLRTIESLVEMRR